MDVIKAIFTTCLEDSISTVSAWDASNGTHLWRYKGGGSVSKHGISLSGGYVLTCEKNKSLIHAWPLNQNIENKQLNAPGKVNCIAFSVDCYYIALGIDDKVFLYLADSGRQLGIGIRHFQHINVVKFTPDGSLICCGGHDGIITVWTLYSLMNDTNPEPMFCFSEHTLPIIDILFDHGSPLGRIISISKDNTLKVYNLLIGEIILSVSFEMSLSSVALSVDKMTVFIGNNEGSIHEFSFRTPPRTVDYSLQDDERIAVFNGHTGTVSSLACTNYLISGSVDKTVKIWSLESRHCLKTLDMKGPVTNIVLATIAKSCFDFSFKPEAIIHDFVDPSNLNDSDDDIEFDKNVNKEHLLKPVTALESVISCSNSNEDSLKAELARQQSVNEKLHSFILSKVLEQNTEGKKPKKKSSRNNKSFQ